MSSQWERYGYRDIFEDGTVKKEKDEDKRLIMSYHFEENDSYAFMRDGACGETHLTWYGQEEDLEKVLEMECVDPTVKELLKNLSVKGKVKSGIYKN